MIKIEEKWQCVGCSNCVTVCPQRCISMTTDNEGFSYPLVDHGQCTNCHRCEKVCPVIEDVSFIQRKTSWLGAYHIDIDIRMKSSSGAVFYEFAKHVIDKGGIVWGAAFDDNLNLRHIPISSLDKLPKLMKSKYLQSDINGAFPKVKKALVNGVPVLFSGTPCQIKALRLFLAKDYERLLTIEVVCHGVPSPAVFHSYCIEKKITNFDFRRKERGWYNYDVCVTKQNGKVLTYRASDDLYMKGFLNNLFLRPSCSNCQAKLFRSAADITLGDFWDVQRLRPMLYNGKGVSLVALHTPKANITWDCIKQNYLFDIIKEREILTEGSMLTDSCTCHPERDIFFMLFNEQGVVKTLKAFFPFRMRLFVKSRLVDIWNIAWEVLLKARDAFLILKDFIYKINHTTPTVVNIEETLRYILQHKCSVSRYGDGEMKFIMGGQTWFQNKDELLQKRLAEILKNRQDGLIVCVPNIFGCLDSFRDDDREYWRKNVAKTRPVWYNNLSRENIYYDAFISRCYLPYKDKARAKEYFTLWKQIWNNRDLLIIEGEKSRLGVGNDLFANVKSVKRILCPNTQAFSFYNSLLNEAKKYEINHLILLAIGPTATILAADLSRSGYQAIDIGHIDVEYEWYLAKVQDKTPIRNKFVNEAGAGLGVGDIKDVKYQNEIVCHF